MSDTHNQESNQNVIQTNVNDSITPNDTQITQNYMQANMCYIIPPQSMAFQNMPQYNEINNHYYQYLPPLKNYNHQLYNYSNFSQNANQEYWNQQVPNHNQYLYHTDNYINSQVNSENSTTNFNSSQNSHPKKYSKKYFRNKSDSSYSKLNSDSNQTYEEKKTKENGQKQETVKQVNSNNNNNETSETKFNHRAYNYSNSSLDYNMYYYNQYLGNFLTSDMANFNLYTTRYANYPSENLNKYNPKDYTFKGEKDGVKESRFFVIKSYSKEDVIHSIKNGIWCSTENGNRKLNQAYIECSNKNIASVYLFFSVNSSGHFCGMAEMTSKVDFEAKSNAWTQDKWKGKFDVDWVFVKNIPNAKLKHIILTYNENKPVTNSRDTQEVLFDQAIEVLNVFRTFSHRSTILDDSEYFLTNNQFNQNSNNKQVKNKFDSKNESKKVDEKKPLNPNSENGN